MQKIYTILISTNSILDIAYPVLLEYLIYFVLKQPFQEDTIFTVSNYNWNLFRKWFH